MGLISIAIIWAILPTIKLVNNLRERADVTAFGRWSRDDHPASFWIWGVGYWIAIALLPVVVWFLAPLIAHV